MPHVAHQETDPSGLQLIIEQDELAPDPRLECDQLGTMICWHRRYLLGDRHDYPKPLDYRRAVGADILELPVYLYDHSGLTMQTTPFSAAWDSGQVGWIFVERRKALAAFGRQRLSRKLRNRILERLRSEIIRYDQWLRGDVWRATVVDPENDLLDACNGFYGEDDAITEGRAMLKDAAANQRALVATEFVHSLEREQLELSTCPENCE